MGNDDVVTALLTYSVATGLKPASEYRGPRNARRRVVGTFEERPVQIRNARPIAARCSLDENGFAFFRRGTAVSDFFDSEHVRSAYYAELAQLVTEASGPWPRRT
jgi:hypothetical protein